MFDPCCREKGCFIRKCSIESAENGVTQNLLYVKFAILFMLYLLSIITTMQQGEKHNANITKTVVTFVGDTRAGSLKTEKVDAQ